MLGRGACAPLRRHSLTVPLERYSGGCLRIGGRVRLLRVGTAIRHSRDVPGSMSCTPEGVAETVDITGSNDPRQSSRRPQRGPPVRAALGFQRIFHLSLLLSAESLSTDRITDPTRLPVILPIGGTAAAAAARASISVGHVTGLGALSCFGVRGTDSATRFCCSSCVWRSSAHAVASITSAQRPVLHPPRR
jgi:hypothetical protein